MPSTDTHTKMPTLPPQGFGSIASNCAAFVVAAVLAGGMVLLAIH